ncbi:MAG: 4Fe-4S binding protein [Spirochaetota bacterium]
MDSYDTLQQILDSHPSTAPKTKTFMEILHILFAPQEAQLATHMSFKGKSVKDIASASHMDMESVHQILEQMANKAIIYTAKKDNEVLYGLVPTIPGLFEFPFMKGMTTETHKKLAQLWETYHHEALGNSFSGNPTPLMRVLPIDTALEPGIVIHPFEEARKLIEKAQYIALTNCACRVSVHKCDKPLDVCMIFDGAAEFLVDRGYAWKASVDQTINALMKSEKAGLVHTSNNSKDRATVICNCCPCCCTVLRGRTQAGNINAFSTSRFEAKIDINNCSGCEACVNGRCPMNAITMFNGIASVVASQCIGCGLCASVCSSNAITLIERTSAPTIPATVTDMGIKVAQEKGRLDRFIEVMKK